MKLYMLISIILIISSFFYIFSLLYDPRIRELPSNTENIMKKHKPKNTLSIYFVTFFSSCIPILCFFYCFQKTSIPLENVMLFCVVFLTCNVTVVALVENIKNLVGRLRPDFLDRCKPIIKICKGNKKIILDGRKSFPSGHSATCGCGFIFLILFINSQFVKSINNFNLNIPLIKVLLNVCFLIIPIYVGTTRYLDHRHFITDIIAGNILGGLVSLIFFKKFGKRCLENVNC